MPKLYHQTSVESAVQIVKNRTFQAGSRGVYLALRPEVCAEFARQDGVILVVDLTDAQSAAATTDEHADKYVILPSPSGFQSVNVHSSRDFTCSGGISANADGSGASTTSTGVVKVVRLNTGESSKPVQVGAGGAEVGWVSAAQLHPSGW
jgi:hypothetical protein